MKKITLFSFFKSNNIGDLLIAQKVAQEFNRYYDCTFCDITDFGLIDFDNFECKLNAYVHSEEKISKFKKAILNVEFFRSAIGAIKACFTKSPEIALNNSKNSELVIFAGGNSLMELDLFPNNLSVMLKTVALLKKKGKKVAFIFCGVGPFRTKLSYTIFTKILSLLDFISVRDDSSYTLVKNALTKSEVEIWRDPVFLYDNEIGVKSDSIGVNVYFGYRRKDKDNIKDAYVYLIRKLRESFPERNVYLFSSEAQDFDNIMDVKVKLLDDNSVIVKNIYSAKELFSLHRSVCCVIGTRMHSIITAIVSHKPLVTISWQKKVDSLAQYFNREDLNISMEEFAKFPEKICDKVFSLIQQSDTVLKENDAILLKTRNEIKNRMCEFLERF